MIDFTNGGVIQCEQYQPSYRLDCQDFDKDTQFIQREECMGCYIDNYCKYTNKLFDDIPNTSYWLQPKLFLYFLALSGILMSIIGFYIFANLRDVYPYDLVAASCLVEAAIYFRFMRLAVCPSQVYYTLALFFPVMGPITNEVLFNYFQTIVVLFAGQIYAFSFINLSLQMFLCIDFYLTLKNPFYPRQRRG